MAFAPPPIRSSVVDKPIVPYDTMKKMLITAGIFSPDEIISDDRRRSVCIYKQGPNKYVMKLGNHAKNDNLGETTKFRLLQNEHRVYMHLRNLPTSNYTNYFPAIIRGGEEEDDDDSTKNFYYIIMEYIEGVPLSDYIEHYTSTSPSKEDVFTILENLTKGLAVMYSTGIVHGDLSAENIMLQENGDIKIIDFEKASTGKKLSENTIGSTRLNRNATARNIEIEEKERFGIGYIFLVMKLLSLIRFSNDLILALLSVIWDCDKKCENVYLKCLPIIIAFKSDRAAGEGATSPVNPAPATPSSSLDPMNARRRKLRKRKTRKL
jgi:serine/threonine protein kinase